MLNKFRLIAPGAIQRGSEEYFGQILAFGALYATATVANKLHEYFTAPIKIATEATDNEEVNADDQSVD